MNRFEERELIERSLHGDEEAFARLVFLHRPKVFRHCLGIVKDEEIAEDLSQETFLHAYQHLASFRKEARFSTWLWRIAHNLSLNYLKKHHFIEQEFRDELLIPQEIQDNELLERIQEGLSLLSAKHRVVFEMYDLQHIPQKQIAVELNIPYGTVRSRLHYAREQIKKFLREA